MQKSSIRIKFFFEYHPHHPSTRCHSEKFLGMRSPPVDDTERATEVCRSCAKIANLIIKPCAILLSLSHLVSYISFSNAFSQFTTIIFPCLKSLFATWISKCTINLGFCETDRIIVDSSFSITDKSYLIASVHAIFSQLPVLFHT